jgi:predicted site-specific integrase-resolvase
MIQGELYENHLANRNNTRTAADMPGVNCFSIYRLIQRGKLKLCRALRGKLLVPRTELMKLLGLE